jgi:signal transduction histidine kinase
MVEDSFVGFAGFEKYTTNALWNAAEIDLLRAVMAALSLWRTQRTSEEKLRLYADELQQQNEDLDAFSHTVAHDLKTPLAILASSSEMLLAMPESLSEADMAELVQLIHKYAAKAIDIIDELLLLASTRQAPVQVEPINMGDIINCALASLAHVIVQAEARVVKPVSWPLVRGYAPWLEEVWVNYISNGLKYGGVPPRLHLGATPEEDGLICFWIRDNGDGLSPEEQAQLFAPFTRLDNAHADGHGLGLSIVRRIVEKLGGTVRVESSGIPGQGSCFSFTLPAIN